MSRQTGQKTRPEIIPFDSDAAAQRKQVEGWVSREGLFYADDERTARYAGCTHVKCTDCRTLIPKTTTVCDSCQTIRQTAAYTALQFKPWDLQTPLVIFSTDTYFFSLEAIAHYCRQKSLTPEQLQLVICEPVCGSEIDIADHLAAELPEDGEVPDEILEAAEKLNEAIRAAAPLCWIQGEDATRIDSATLFPSRTEVYSSD